MLLVFQIRDSMQFEFSSCTVLLEISHPQQKLFANLHAQKRRLNLARRTCSITDNTRGTIFVNEVQPKPSPRGTIMALLPNTSNTAALGFRQRAAALLRTYCYVIMVTTAALLSYL